MSIKKTSSMTFHEKLKFYATGRPTVGTLSQIVDGEFVDYFVGKVRSIIVTNKNGEYKFNDTKSALQCAIEFRNNCRKDATELGLL